MKILANYPNTVAKSNINQTFCGNWKIKLAESEDSCRFSDSKISNYVLDNKTLKLKRVNFTEPLHVADALKSIANCDNTLLQEKFLESYHTMDELMQMGSDLKKLPELSKYKVDKLFSFGVFALAFETEDGQILKITANEHFPYGRKPDFFDLPILKQGKSGYTHYYLEEKVSQDNLTQKELRDFVRSIKDKGYTLKDYLVHYDETKENNTIRKSQFGRAKDGKIYLIDPGCAIAPPESFFNLKRLKNAFSRKFRFKP